MSTAFNLTLAPSNNLFGEARKDFITKGKKGNAFKSPKDYRRKPKHFKGWD